MNPLSVTELKSMRQTVATLYTTRVEVWRRTSTPDAGGGPVDAYALHSVVWGNYSQGGGGSAGDAERSLPTPDMLVLSQDYAFRFARGTDVQHEDRLITEGKTFEVSWTTTRTDELELSMRVGAKWTA